MFVQFLSGKRREFYFRWVTIFDGSSGWLRGFFSTFVFVLLMVGIQERQKCVGSIWILLFFYSRW